MHAENGAGQVAFKAPSQFPSPYGTAAIWVLKEGGVGCEGVVSKGGLTSYPASLKAILMNT